MENNTNDNVLNTGVPSYPQYNPEIIKKYEFTARETVFAFIAAVLGFLFIKLTLAPFFNRGRMGLGACIFLLALTVYGLTFYGKKKKVTPKKALRTALCIVFSLNVFISSNIVIQFLDAVFVLLIILYDNLTESEEKYEQIRDLFPIDMLRAAIVLPFSDYDACSAAMKGAAEKNKAGKNIKNALLGLAIALPSTIVVGFLLMNADKGFADIIESLFSNSIYKIFIFLFQLAVGMPAAFYIFGLFRAAHSDTQLSDDEKCMENIRSVRFLPTVAGVFSALPVCVLYVIFFFSQLNYFISSFFSKLPEDMASYSQYARRGFFELCMVSVINLAIIIALNLFCKYREDGSKPTSIKAVTCVLSVFTLLLIATAVSKMIMYIDVYGLTLLRVYTTWFMLLLTVVFIGIFLSQVMKKINLAGLTVTAFTVMFAVLSFCNVDGIIAGYNIDRYLDGTLEKPDSSMLAELSSGAVPQIRRLKNSDYDQKRLNNIIINKIEEGSGDMRIITLSDIIAWNGEE